VHKDFTAEISTMSSTTSPTPPTTTTTSSSAAAAATTAAASSAAGSNSASKTAFLWLVLWMINNIGVTLLNKAAFAKVDFHYPYFLSAVHMCCNMLGSQWVFWSMSKSTKGTTAESSENDNHIGSDSKSTSTSSWVSHLLGNQGAVIVRKQLDASGKRMILWFSLIFSLNIAIGNVSLRHVSVNFNQVMRSLVPAMTIAMDRVLFGKIISSKRQMAVVPVIVGVAMACFGDMSYTTLGLFYTVMCIVLAALKVVASGHLLTGPSLKLHPVDLLAHMAPLALVQCMVLAYITGEIQAIAARWSTELSPFVDYYPMLVVWMSGVFSFTLNISSLQANKLTSPLTLCIAANVKQVLMIILSTVLFGVEVTLLNGAGIAVVLFGSARYSYVSVVEKTQATKQAVEERQHLNTKTIGDGSADDNNEELTSEMAPFNPQQAKRRGQVAAV